MRGGGSRYGAVPIERPRAIDGGKPGRASDPTPAPNGSSQPSQSKSGSGSGSDRPNFAPRGVAGGAIFGTSELALEGCVESEVAAAVAGDPPWSVAGRVAVVDAGGFGVVADRSAAKCHAVDVVEKSPIAELTEAWAWAPTVLVVLPSKARHIDVRRCPSDAVVDA